MHLQAATLREVQHEIRDNLSKIYPKEEANAIAQELLLHALSSTKTQLSLRWDEPVTPNLQNQLQAWLTDLLQHKPLQYVLNQANFYGLELEVSPAVLIPRPETEELVDLIIRTHQNSTHLHVMDIGTGSGCIPVTLGLHLQIAKNYAVDISAEAISIAKRNAKNHHININFIQADILSDTMPVPEYSLDILVSNPPYVLNQEKEQMRQNVLAFEPHVALFVPDHDPLRFYTKIAGLARKLLKPGGYLYFEINEQFGKQTVEMLKQLGFKQIELIKDMFGKDRFTVAKN